MAIAHGTISRKQPNKTCFTTSIYLNVHCHFEQSTPTRSAVRGTTNYLIHIDSRERHLMTNNFIYDDAEVFFGEMKTGSHAARFNFDAPLK